MNAGNAGTLANAMLTAVRPLPQRLALLCTVLRAWEPVLWVSVAVMAALIIPLRYAIGQNSDGLLQTLISLQHLTFFFWEQERFANLLPWLASFITDPTANVEFQLALRIGLGVAAPLLFCVPGAPGGDCLAAGRATLLATALMLAFVPQRFIHELFVEASPYGTSFALGGFALLLFTGAAWRRGGAAIALRSAGLLLSLAAYLVNASLVLFTAPLFAAQAVLLGSRLAMEFGVASAIAGLGTAVAVGLTAAGTPAGSMRFGESTIGLTYYASELTRKPGIFLAAMGALLLLALMVEQTAGRPSDRAFARNGAVLIVTFVIGLFEISLSSWVILNYMHPRYLVPLYVLMAAVGALSVLNLVERVSARSAVRNMVTLGVCVALLMVAGLRKPEQLPLENGVVAAPFRPLAAAIADTVTQGRLDGVAGDYWTVWPGVFLAEQQAHDSGAAAGNVFGLTYRGRARRQAMTARLFARGQLKIACVDLPNAEACRGVAAEVLGLPSLTVHLLSPELPLSDGHTLRIVSLTPPGR